MLLLVTAFQEEYRLVQSLLTNVQKTHAMDKFPFKACTGSLQKQQVHLIMTGQGQQKVNKSLLQFLELEQVSAIITLGYCGGISQTLKVGDVFVPSKFFNKANQSLENIFAQRIAHILGAQTGSMIMVESPLLGFSEKEKYKAHATVDMESYELAEIAKKKGLPFILIKAVLDDKSTELSSIKGQVEITQKILQNKIVANEGLKKTIPMLFANLAKLNIIDLQS